MRRPRWIRCAACGKDKPARHAREAQLTWCRAFDGEGSHTDPQRLERTGIIVCADCWKGATVLGADGQIPETAAEARDRAKAALGRPKERQGTLLGPTTDGGQP